MTMAPSTPSKRARSVVLVLVAGLEELLEEGRVGAAARRVQHVELDPLGALLGEGGVPRPDLDGVHKGILPAGRDTRRDAGHGRPPWPRRNAWHGDPVGPRCGRCTMVPSVTEPPRRTDQAQREHMESSQERAGHRGVPGRAARLAPDHLTPEVVEAGGHQIEGELPRGPAGLEPDAGRRRVGGAVVAGRARRARRRRPRAAGLPRRDEPRPGPGPGQRDRRLQHRAGDHAVRHPRAAGALPPADAAGRRDLVAGHVRARRRLRPGLAAHRRRRGRRRLRDQRAEDLELARALGRLVPALRADGPDGEEARRDHVLPGRPAHAGHRGAAAHHHHGRAVLRRALLHRRPRSSLGHAWARFTQGGRLP